MIATSATSKNWKKKKKERKNTWAIIHAKV
jgi:hypothetical protein